MQIIQIGQKAGGGVTSRYFEKISLFYPHCYLLGSNIGIND